MENEKKSLKNLPAEQQFQEIDQMAKRLGVPKPAERPVLVMKSSENGNKILELKRGNWEDEQPWFVIDEEGKLLILSSAEAMTGMINALQHMGQEVFKSRLEKAIAKELPIDFHDVWTVAMHELQQRLKEGGKEASSVDLDHLIKSIKRRHPNLFYSLKDLQIDEEEMREAGF